MPNVEIIDHRPQIKKTLARVGVNPEEIRPHLERYIQKNAPPDIVQEMSQALEKGDILVALVPLMIKKASVNVPKGLGSAVRLTRQRVVGQIASNRGGVLTVNKKIPPSTFQVGTSAHLSVEQTMTNSPDLSQLNSQPLNLVVDGGLVFGVSMGRIAAPFQLSLDPKEEIKTIPPSFIKLKIPQPAPKGENARQGKKAHQWAVDIVKENWEKLKKDKKLPNKPHDVLILLSDKNYGPVLTRLIEAMHIVYEDLGAMSFLSPSPEGGFEIDLQKPPAFKVINLLSVARALKEADERKPTCSQIAELSVGSSTFQVNGKKIMLASGKIDLLQITLNPTESIQDRVPKATIPTVPEERSSDLHNKLKTDQEIPVTFHSLGILDLESTIQMAKKTFWSQEGRYQRFNINPDGSTTVRETRFSRTAKNLFIFLYKQHPDFFSRIKEIVALDLKFLVGDTGGWHKISRTEDLKEGNYPEKHLNQVREYIFLLCSQLLAVEDWALCKGGGSSYGGKSN